MDQIEKDELLPVPEETSASTDTEPIVEDMASAEEINDAAQVPSEVQEQADVTEDAQAALPAKPKQKKAAKIILKAVKILSAALFVLALVVAGCFLSVQYCNQYWVKQYNLLWQNMNEKNAALQQQIDGYKDAFAGAGNMTDPAGNLSASQIYEQNVNSVVAIVSTKRSGESDKIAQSTSAGTGFIITEDGYIVTNHHVIDGATKITVILHNGTEYGAKLVGSDANNDLAVLKINAMHLDPVTMGSSSQMQVGDQVLAIGNALGEFSASLTVGYISGMDRNVSTDGTVINMIQTDAAINSGNSGGPLFNARGEVIGITTAKYSGTSSSGATIEGIGFAIPLDDVIGMIEDLRDLGYIRSTFLGVMVFEVDASVALTYNLPQGVYVQEVTPGYCAEKAGILAKDIIIELGGHQIKTMNDLSRALRSFEPGTTVTVVVWRAGREIPLSITLDAKPMG